MSFGFSVGDFIAVKELVNRIRKEFVDAPSQFKAISDELRSLEIVLLHVEVVLSNHNLRNEQEAEAEAELKQIASSLRNILDQLEYTLDEDKELKSGDGSISERVERVWKRRKWEPEDIKQLRSCFNTSIGLLDAFASLLARDNMLKLIRQKDIQERQAALAQTPVDHPDRARQLQYLGLGYYNKYKATGAIADLDIAILRFQEALDITPADHPDRASRLQNALQTGRQAVATTPEDQPDHATRFSFFESLLKDSFQGIGTLQDLDEHGKNILGLETRPRLQIPESSAEYEPSETCSENGSVFSLPESISSKSSAYGAVGTTRELVMLLVENTHLRSFYPSLRQNFEFTIFKSELHQLLRIFSKDLSKEASTQIEKESVRFINQHKRHVSSAIGQEVFGLKNQFVLQSISQRQRLNTRERIEKYLTGITQSKSSGNELPLRQGHTSENDSTDDDDELESFSNIEYVKEFLLKTKAFENLRISIGKLAAKGEESTTEVQSRYNVTESENNARNNHKLAPLQQFYWYMLRLFRPKLEVGYRRLEWQCDCGTPLYGDFRGDSEEICKLARQIQGHGYVVRQSGHGIKHIPAVSRQTATSNSAVSAPLPLDTSHTTHNASLDPTSTTSQAPEGTKYPTVDSTIAATSLRLVTAQSPKFVALCIKTGQFQKTYDEIDISTIPKSTQVFHDFRRTYERCVGSRRGLIRRWLTKPVDIGFIQFAVEGLRRIYHITGSPDCTICAHAEKKDGLVTARKYEPHINVVALTHPPIPADLFFHLWECPVNITPTIQKMWLDRLPKRLDEKLENACLRTRPDGELIIGWGLLLIEGLHKRRISRLTAAIVALSIIISVTYSASTKDVSSGFAVGALLVGCWSILITTLYFEWVVG